MEFSYATSDTAETARSDLRRSVNGMATEMPQLVRIAHDINCDDPAIVDLKRGGLQRVVLLDRDETRLI